jgi:hypothetical protein
VLDTLTEKDFQEAFHKWRRLWTGVYMREGTTSRVMAADRPYGEFYDSYNDSPEYFGNASYLHLITRTFPVDIDGKFAVSRVQNYAFQQQSIICDVTNLKQQENGEQTLESPGFPCLK